MSAEMRDSQDDIPEGESGEATTDVQDEVEIGDVAEGSSGEAGATDEEPAVEVGAVVEASEVEQLRAELEEARDRHLRIAAEFENFRKRNARERTDLWGRAQADLVRNLLEAIDDLGRVADLDPDLSASSDVIAGVELVERKLMKELEAAGLERVGEESEVFDPNRHEAIGSVPAETAEEDHTVGTVLQVGYALGNVLIRPARVQVRMWHGEGTAQD